MTKEDFNTLSLAEQGLELINNGKHLTQIKQGNRLLNLYSFNDFFVEVYYSFLNDKIDKIEIVTDLSRIDYYIDEQQQQQEEKPQIN